MLSKSLLLIFVICASQAMYSMNVSKKIIQLKSATSSNVYAMDFEDLKQFDYFAAQLRFQETQAQQNNKKTDQSSIPVLTIEVDDHLFSLLNKYIQLQHEQKISHLSAQDVMDGLISAACSIKGDVSHIDLLMQADKLQLKPIRIAIARTLALFIDEDSAIKSNIYNLAAPYQAFILNEINPSITNAYWLLTWFLALEKKIDGKELAQIHDQYLDFIVSNDWLIILKDHQKLLKTIARESDSPFCKEAFVKLIDKLKLDIAIATLTFATDAMDKSADKKNLSDLTGQCALFVSKLSHLAVFDHQIAFAIAESMKSLASIFALMHTPDYQTMPQHIKMDLKNLINKFVELGKDEKSKLNPHLKIFIEAVKKKGVVITDNILLLKQEIATAKAAMENAADTWLSSHTLDDKIAIKTYADRLLNYIEAAMTELNSHPELGGILLSAKKDLALVLKRIGPEQSLNYSNIIDWIKNNQRSYQELFA